MLQKSGSYKNTGIGSDLANCKMVVEMMKGSIICHSTESKVTLISLFISVEVSLKDDSLS
jgi:hypothetical protein